MSWFRRSYRITDLKDRLPPKLKDLEKSFVQYRKDFKILIIDDKQVSFADTLRSLDYVVHAEKDIKKLSEAEKFDLVLCDRQGVGQLMAATREGVFLAKKIKEAYPFKPVILYSSSVFTLEDYDAIRSLDDIITDAPDPETFADYVDCRIKELMDPVLQWQKLHIELAKRGISAKDICEVESDYVKQIIKTGTYKANGLIIEGVIKSLGKDLIINFAAQAIFQLLKQGIE